MDSNSFAEEQASNDFEISDPSTRGGFRTLSAREVPLELRFQTDTEAPQDVGSLEAVQVKILVGEGAPTVRVELTSESDLFFHYTSTIDERTFRTMREEQHLMVEFADFCNVLSTNFNNVVKEPQTFLAVLIMNKEGQARLDIIQNVQFKFVELLSLPFNRSNEETVRESISYRYAKVKTQAAVVQSKLQEVVALVKVKNPSLLLALTQNAQQQQQQKMPGSATPLAPAGQFRGGTGAGR